MAIELEIETKAEPKKLDEKTGPRTSTGWSYLASPGRIDAFNFAVVSAELKSFVADSKYVAYDVSGLQFMCLPMIKTLASLASELSQRGGRFALIGSTEKLKRQLLIYASLDPFICLSIEKWRLMEQQS